MNKKDLRSSIFKHLDGIVTLPVIVELNKAGVLNYLSQHKTSTLQHLTDHFTANTGYLNVALRVLASQGFLSYDTQTQVTVKITATFNYLLKYADALTPIMDSMQFSK